jgi:hypothetical protein
VVANANAYVVTATQQGAAPQNTSEFSSCSTLPISILSFTALPSSEGTKVTWTYSTEDHVSSFYLYGSSDGVNYLPIYSYSVTTTAPLASVTYADVIGYSYYKIIAYYPSGKTSVHGPISSNSEITLTWYPNRASNEIVIKTIELTVITISDMKGNIMITISLEIGEHILPLDGLISVVFKKVCISNKRFNNFLSKES